MGWPHKAGQQPLIIWWQNMALTMRQQQRH
jgi:hypothetical protein